MKNHEKWGHVGKNVGRGYPRKKMDTMYTSIHKVYSMK